MEKLENKHLQIFQNIRRSHIETYNGRIVKIKTDET
jgi:hypothetical protein